MSKFLICFLFLFSSCNVLEVISDKSNVSDEFYYLKSSFPFDFFEFWRFNESSNPGSAIGERNTSLIDNVSGGIAFTGGIAGNAVDCASGTGASGFLENNSYNFSFSNDWSISFWAYKSANASGGCGDEQTVVSFNTDASYIQFDNLDCENDNTDLRIKLNGTNFDFIDIVNFPGYNHFTFVGDTSGSNISLYVNGTFQNSVAGNFTDTTSSIVVCSFDSGIQKLNGQLDMLGFWSRQLSQDEIYNVMNYREY